MLETTLSLTLISYWKRLILGGVSHRMYGGRMTRKARRTLPAGALGRRVWDADSVGRSDRARTAAAKGSLVGDRAGTSKPRMPGAPIAESLSLRTGPPASRLAASAVAAGAPRPSAVVLLRVPARLLGADRSTRPEFEALGDESPTGGLAPEKSLHMASSTMPEVRGSGPLRRLPVRNIACGRRSDLLTRGAGISNVPVLHWPGHDQRLQRRVNIRRVRILRCGNCIR